MPTHVTPQMAGWWLTIGLAPRVAQFTGNRSISIEVDSPFELQPAHANFSPRD